LLNKKPVMSPKKLPTEISTNAAMGEINPLTERLPARMAMVPPGEMDPITGNPSAKANRNKMINRHTDGTLARVAITNAEN